MKSAAWTRIVVNEKRIVTKNLFYPRPRSLFYALYCMIVLLYVISNSVTTATLSPSSIAYVSTTSTLTLTESHSQFQLVAN